MTLQTKMLTLRNLISVHVEERKCFAFCKSCGTQCTYQESNHKLRCRASHCRRNNELFNNSILVGSIEEMVNSLLMLELWVKGGRVSSVSSFFGVDDSIVKKVIMEFNELFKIYNDNIMLGGVGMVVEIDESKFGKRKYNRGKKVIGTWCVGLVERGSKGKIFIMPVLKRDKLTLHQLIAKHVKKGTTIITDEWKGYIGLDQIGFIHKTVNHSIQYSRYENEFCVHSNTIEGHWRSLKDLCPSRYRSYDYIEPYLNLYMLKRNLDGNLMNFIINKLLV